MSEYNNKFETYLDSGHLGDTTLQVLELLLDSARGTYIPENFVEQFNLEKFGLDRDSWEVQTCANRDNNDYWEAWETILNNAEYHVGGNVWRLHHDGDLWLICYELMTDEEKQNFGFDL